MAYWVPAGDLPGLDFREQGYRRVEVGEAIEAYPGFSLNGPVAAYVDVDTSVVPAPVAAGYLNMGILGAQRIDRLVPGFLDDFCRDTPLPPGGMANRYFFYLGADGRTVWWLHLESEQRTLLARLPVSLFADAEASPEQTPDWSTPSPTAWSAYDQRWPAAARAGDHIDHPLLLLLGQAIAQGAADSLAHPCWLVRLGCLAAPGRQAQASTLQDDPDAWVRRAAAAILNEPISSH